jgi:hypothetical protein
MAANETRAPAHQHSQSCAPLLLVLLNSLTANNIIYPLIHTRHVNCKSRKPTELRRLKGDFQYTVFPKRLAVQQIHYQLGNVYPSIFPHFGMKRLR